MDIVNGFFVLGYRNKLLYFFIDNFLRSPGNEGRPVQIDGHKIRSITVKTEKKIICMNKIGGSSSCVVVEDLVTREASFMSLKMVTEDKKNEESKIKEPSSKHTSNLGEILEEDSEKENKKDDKSLKRKSVILPTNLIPSKEETEEEQEEWTENQRMILIGLSIKDRDNSDNSPLLKYHSTASLETDELSKKQKWYHVGMLLRENGRVEIYSDFILVDTIEPDKLQVVDIEVGDNNFFLKCLKKTTVVNENMTAKELDDPDLYQFYRVKKKWRNRVGFGTLVEDKKLERI